MTSNGLRLVKSRKIFIEKWMIFPAEEFWAFIVSAEQVPRWIRFTPIFKFIYTVKKLTNTNKNTNKIFLLIYYSEFYWYNFSFLYSLVNTEENFTSVYIDRIAVEK